MAVRERCMPRMNKGGWKWNLCAVFILADRIRAGDSSTVCAEAIMAQQRAAYPDMALNNNSIIAAMRNKGVPALIEKVCPDHEELIRKFHTHKPGRGKKGNGGWGTRTSPKKDATVTAQKFLEFRQKQHKSPAS